MNDPIINKVADSGIVTIDPGEYYPKGEVMVFDLREHLFMGLILKEKDFRDALKKMDWENYRGKNVAVTCSADAVIPVWAYMLVTSYLQPVAATVFMGTEREMHKHLFLQNIAAIDVSPFIDKRIVIKGCGEPAVGEFVYLELTRRLLPLVKSIMYGEPCSTVPVYKKAIEKKMD